jgi:hypothetical protein
LKRAEQMAAAARMAASPLARLTWGAGPGGDLPADHHCLEENVPGVEQNLASAPAAPAADAGELAPDWVQRSAGQPRGVGSEHQELALAS